MHFTLLVSFSLNDPNAYLAEMQGFLKLDQKEISLCALEPQMAHIASQKDCFS